MQPNTEPHNIDQLYGGCTERYRQALTDAAQQVFADMAFIFLDEDYAANEDAAGFGSDEVVYGKLPFHGARNGFIEIKLPQTVAIEVAANILGLDACDVTPGQNCSDATGELLNVVTGLWINKIKESGFINMGTPDVVGIPENQAPVLGNTDNGYSAAVCFKTDMGDPVVMGFHVVAA